MGSGLGLVKGRLTSCSKVDLRSGCVASKLEVARPVVRAHTFPPCSHRGPNVPSSGAMYTNLKHDRKFLEGLWP